MIMNMHTCSHNLLFFQSIFVTKIASGGLAEQDGRLRLGDKLLKVCICTVYIIYIHVTKCSNTFSG